MKRLVSYIRVSSKSQGISGLGLEAQQSMIRNYAATHNCEIITEYTEVESGKNNSRPVLAKAMKHADVMGATLIVAKLDRLSRSLFFLSQLQENKVDFIVVEIPSLDVFTLGIYGSLAAREREMISERTKAALTAAKARGPYFCPKRQRMTHPLGAFGKINADPEKFKEGRAIGRESQRLRADKFANKIIDIIQAIKDEGITTLKGIAAVLNERGIPSARGNRGAWYPTTVKNILSRL